MDKDQTIRYSKDEIALIKQLLGSRVDVVQVLRKHFFQFEITAEEKTFLQSLSPDVLAILEKVLLPTLSPDVPLTLEANPYSTLATIDQFYPDLAYVHIAANDILVTFFEQQFDALTKESPQTIILALLPQPLGIDQREQRIINVMAYNKIVPLIDGRLNVLNYYNNLKEETEAEQAARLAKDSTQ